MYGKKKCFLNTTCTPAYLPIIHYMKKKKKLFIIMNSSTEVVLVLVFVIALIKHSMYNQ